MLDDRSDVRVGEKFAEFELIGVPVAIVIGKRGLEAGTAEVRRRLTGEKLEVRLEELVTVLLER